MVTMTTTATNPSPMEPAFRARTTTGAASFGDKGIVMPIVGQDVFVACVAGYLGAIGVETTGLPSVATPLGSRAWSPPS
jgi:hypothetical protein